MSAVLQPSHARTRRLARRLLAIPLATAVAFTGVTLSDPASPEAQAAETGTFLKTFSAANEGVGKRTREQAIADAKKFDVISATPNQYREHVAAMRQANPDLVLLVYVNGTFAQKREGSKFPASWYILDKYGRKVTSRGYGNYMMNPSNPSWVENRVQMCRAQLQLSGYGGCMLDMLGTAPTMASYVSSPGINPATKRAWTATEWQRATTALASKVDAGTIGPLWGNGYGSATRYFSTDQGSSKILSNGVQGALTEVWIRTAQQSHTTYPDVTQWKQAVDQLVDLGRNGERTAVMVKLWAKGTQAQKDSWHRFALATFLLGSDGKSSFQASYIHGDALAGHRYWTGDIGTPTGAYALTGGVYQRAFTKGRVLVNPTGVTRTISLGRTYVDLQGVKRTSITLGPKTGDVLRLP